MSFLNTRDAARLLGMKENTLRVMAQKGKIPGYKMGSTSQSTWRFKKEELLGFMENNRNN